MTVRTRLPDGHVRGSTEYRRITVAMFCSGLATFTALYSVQALLPALAEDFTLSPAAASLAVSVGTAGLAIGVIPLTTLSDALGRTRVMTASLLISTVLAIGEAFSPSFTVLLVLRALQGLALAGLQATAMSYLAEELDRGSHGSAVGLYIAGNGIGGMGGRLIAGLLVDLGGWRVALGAVAALALACSVVFRLTILPSVRFSPTPLRWRPLLSSVARSFVDSRLVRLYTVGLLLMGCFVSVYNYLGFRLLAPEFGLSPTLVGLVFVVYLAGSASSIVAGRLVDRFGRPRLLGPCIVVTALGVALMLPDSVVPVLLGLVVTTAGFFAAHAVASGWVGARASVLGVQGAAVYLFLYYLGSSIGGTLGGLFYQDGGWSGISGYLAVLLALALGLALTMLRPKPISQPISPR